MTGRRSKTAAAGRTAAASGEGLWFPSRAELHDNRYHADREVRGVAPVELRRKGLTAVFKARRCAGRHGTCIPEEGGPNPFEGARLSPANERSS